MTYADWNDPAASVLGMRLQTESDDLIVWFNRRMEPVLARLPQGYWTVGMVSDDKAVLPVADGAATLPPRSVVVLVMGQIPVTPPEEMPPPPAEPPVTEPPNIPVTEPEEVPDLPEAPPEPPLRDR
jgi:glycogen operon protein